MKQEIIKLLDQIDDERLLRIIESYLRGVIND